MKKLFLIVFISLIMTTQSSYAIAKLGAFDCKFILQYKDIKQTKISVEDWLNGALTAFQLDRKTIVSIPEIFRTNTSRYYWVVKFCEQNPQKDITEAAFELYLQLTK